MEIVIRASNQLAPGLAAAGAELKAFQSSVGGLGGQLSLPGIGGGGAGGMGLLGAVGPTLAIAGGVAAIAGIVAVANAAKDNYRAQTTALADLKQAYESVNLPASKYMANVQEYIDKNHTYISDQNAVREGYAALTRAGIDQTLVQKGVNDALDLSILRHDDFSDELHKLLLGLEGNSKATKDLGINIKDYGDLTKSHTQILADDEAAQKKVTEASANLAKAQRTLQEEQQRLHDKGYVTANDLMQEQDLKGKVTAATQSLKDAQKNYTDTVQKGNDQIKNQGEYLSKVAGVSTGAKGTLDALSKSQNDVNNAFSHFSKEVGPGLVAAQADWNEHLALGISRLEGLAHWLGIVGDALRGPGTASPASPWGHYVGSGRNAHWVTDPYPLGTPGEHGRIGP
jgi:hypothetical protein